MTQKKIDKNKPDKITFYINCLLITFIVLGMLLVILSIIMR
jgi:hypothetical protein